MSSRGGHQGSGQRGQPAGRRSQGGNRGGTRGGYSGGGQRNHPDGTSLQIVRQPNASPNPEVTKLENAAVSSDIVDKIGSLGLKADEDVPTRPGYGTLGEKIILFANCFELAIRKYTPMHRYGIAVVVGVNEQKPSGKKLERIVQLLLHELGVAQPLVTDFRANIITSTKLLHETKEYLVTYSLEGFQPDAQSPIYKVQVQYVATFSAQEFWGYLASVNVRTSDPGMKQSILQALNIVVAHGMKSSNDVLGVSNKYFPLNGQNCQVNDIDAALVAIRGYFLSVRPGTGRLLVNAQIKRLAMWKPGSMETVLTNLGWKSNARVPMLRGINRQVKGLTVRLTHFTPARTKKVFGLALKSDGRDLKHPPKIQCDGATPDKVSFLLDGQGYVSVAEYFDSQHGKRAHSELPVLNLGNASKPNYCPAQFCEVANGTPYQRRLSPEQTRQMIKIAVQRPEYNSNSIKDKAPAICREYSHQNMNHFGVELDQSLVTVHARVLKAPDLQYKGKSQNTKTIKTESGSWAPYKDQSKFFQGATLGSWHLLWIRFANDHHGGSYRDINSVSKNVNQLREILLKNGMQAPVVSGKHELSISGNVEQCEAAIKAKIGQVSSSNDRPVLMLVVLPDNDSDIYNIVKRAGDITFGIHTVCVISEKLKRGDQAYYGNVALKINLKMGGSNQQMSSEKLGFISAGDTMLVGLDVTHPAAGENQAPSVAAIVASIDNRLGQWPAEISIQNESRQEMIHFLVGLMKGRLHKWHKVNGKYPDEILVYRDGVSEGQYNSVREEELPLIRKACSELYSAAQTAVGVPRITIVVVGKRHHTRFYPTKTEDGNRRTGNIQNGTVVDRGVTEFRVWDFYLTAHTALHGTSRPAHYMVVHDEIFRWRVQQQPSKDGRTQGEQAADLLETTTHNLCYLFGRATKAVSVCPPAYYADIACERARRWLSRLYAEYDSSDGSVAEARDEEVRIHPNLVDSMFYI